MHTDGFSLVESLDGITEYRLDTNNLRVLLVPLRMAPVAVFMVTYRVGSRNESTGETGATHFLEHLMFKGSSRFNSALNTSIFSTLQRKGARVNATTWLDRTNYYEMLPDDDLELAIEIESDRMRGALLDPEDVNSERTVILNELDRGENEPLRKLYQSVWSTAFVAHPYRHPTIGWRSDVEQITPEQLRHFYDTYYWPSNATVSVIGSFDPKKTLESIRSHFGSIESGPAEIPDVTTVEPPQLGERRTIVRMAGEPGAVMTAFKAPDASSGFMPALGILAVILGKGRTSRLYERMVDSGIATGVSASESYLRDPGLFYAYATLVPGTKHAVAEEAILEEMERLTTEPVETSVLERAKAQVYADTVYNRDGPFALASSLNEAIASGDWRLYVRLPDEIKKATVEQIQEAARFIFNRDRMTVGYFVPRKEDTNETG